MGQQRKEKKTRLIRKVEKKRNGSHKIPNINKSNENYKIYISNIKKKKRNELIMC